MWSRKFGNQEDRNYYLIPNLKKRRKKVTYYSTKKTKWKERSYGIWLFKVWTKVQLLILYIYRIERTKNEREIDESRNLMSTPWIVVLRGSRSLEKGTEAANRDFRRRRVHRWRYLACSISASSTTATATLGPTTLQMPDSFLLPLVVFLVCTMHLSSCSSSWPCTRCKPFFPNQARRTRPPKSCARSL
jgi:hypothetical protein